MFVPLWKNYKIYDFFATPFVILLIFLFLLVNFAMMWDGSRDRKHITIIFPDRELRVLSYANTVRMALEGIGTQFNDDYVIIPNPDSPLRDGMCIRLIRRSMRVVKRDIPLYPDDDIVKVMGDGNAITLQGKDVGIKREYYEIVYYNGHPVIKRLIKTRIIKEKRNGIVLIAGDDNPSVFIDPDSGVAYTHNSSLKNSILYVPGEGYFLSSHVDDRSINGNKRDFYILK